MRKLQQVSLLAALTAAPVTQVFAHPGHHEMTTAEIISHVLASPFHMLAAVGVAATLAGLVFLRTRVKKKS